MPSCSPDSSRGSCSDFWQRLGEFRGRSRVCACSRRRTTRFLRAAGLPARRHSGSEARRRRLWRAIWERRQPARFRAEGGPELQRYAAEASEELDEAMRAYSDMHAACTAVERRAMERDPYGTRLECRYLVWSCTFGLGNQLMSLLSSFLFAMLSQRVLLVDDEMWDRLLSNPFQGSEWITPAGLSFKDADPPSMADFRGLRCAAPSPDSRCGTNVVRVVFAMGARSEDEQLLVCPSFMEDLRNVTFLDFRNSNQHFAVGFFLNPALRPMLELLFPKRNVFHLLSRFLLIPSDVVWDQIRSIHDQHLYNASRRIGVQLRESKGDYRHYFDDAVPLCIKSRLGLCPIEMDEVLERESHNQSLSRSTEFTTIFLASLVGGHFTKLQERLHRLEAETKLSYVLVAQPADGEQMDDVVHQQKALVDIWILSLSDVILTTHLSTFGYAAQALAGITPYHLKHWLDNPCQLSLSSDPCYHFAPKRVACGENLFTLRDSSQEVPYIKPCPDIPETGLQLQEP